MEHPVLESSRRHLREWHRGVPERKIAGVCAGLAEQLELPLTVVRTAFVLSAVIPPLSTIGITTYLVLWFLMPPSRTEPSGFDRVVDAVGAFTDDFGDAREDRAVRREIEETELR